MPSGGLLVSSAFGRWWFSFGGAGFLLLVVLPLPFTFENLVNGFLFPAVVIILLLPCKDFLFRLGASVLCKGLL
jgi:hypothetical protein